MKTWVLFSLFLVSFLAAACVSAPVMPAAPAATTVSSVSPISESALPAQNAGAVTARMLVAPNALVGPSPSSFNWSPVGATLAYVEPQDGQNMLWLYDAATGDKRLLLDPSKNPGNIDVTSAQWSPQGDRLLLTGAEALWLLDLSTGELTSVVENAGSITGQMFTPDGNAISYVQDNDLYVLNLADGKVQRLTTDGGETVFNGGLDWVYTEELATRAAQPGYAWSPDGVWLMFLRLDETAVPNDPVTDYRPIPATVSYTRYPTAGTANPVASLHALAQGATAPPLEVPLPAGTEYVLPFFTWTPDSNHALFITVNRDHTELILNMWTPQSGEVRTLIKETAPDWINEDRYAAPIFLRQAQDKSIGDGSQFLWLSERDGFMHLYLYARDGTLVKQLTQGEWMIDSSAYNLLTPGRPVHVDPTGTWAYFTTTRGGPLERQIARVNLATGELEQVSEQPGFHLPALSSDGNYLVDQHSAVDTPPITAIVKTDGSGATVLAEAAGPALTLPQVTREFVTLKAHDGTDLYAQLVKPETFDPNQKYPVVVHWYGGPGLQMVSNRYGTTNIFNIIERDVLYTQEGFLVWRLDNRGAFGRGHAFETPIFGELGKAALDDQLAGLEYLKTLPYVDATRIGTDGKSFGGYMTLYALLHAPEIFRCGVAGAAPTDWRYYDTIYTERYMRTPEVNPDGYAATNLIDMAATLQARPLLIHGLADTNVHLQNTVNFIEALEANDKLFDFIPLPNRGHSFRGDGLVAALMASVDYLSGCLTGAPRTITQPAPAPTAAPTAPAIANPASENCAKQGGTVSIEARGDGGQYGVCLFEDNLQCEEWALLRGECPAGGVKITGYATPAARYCAITGGTYAITDKSSQEDEQGICTFSSGAQCDVWDYYTGKCDANAAPPQTPAPTSTAEPAPSGAALQPLDAAACMQFAEGMAQALGVGVTIGEAPFTEPISGATGTACQVTATGTGKQFQNPTAAVDSLAQMLTEQGWEKDPMLAADGPTGAGSGFRKEDQVCLAGARWEPDASANCPTDQPISTCQVKPEQQLYTVTLDCAQSTAEAAGVVGMANPASVNCTEQGGTLAIETRGDGGQYGVCYFKDNLQCEEWALMRGECPVGGVKVTGYVTPAARYCAITGGTYAITGKSGADDEQGTCTFPHGGQCDVWDYYNGKCVPTSAGS